VCHVLRMLEGIMVFGVHCRCQRIDGSGIFRISALVGTADRYSATNVIRIHLDCVFSGPLDSINRGICVSVQFPGRGGHVWCCTDTDADSQTACGFGGVHVGNLLRNIVCQALCGIYIITGKNQCKFITVDTCSIGVFVDDRGQNCCNALQSGITFQGAVQLVVKLEVIDADQTQRQGCVLIFFKFTVQDFKEELQIYKTCQIVLLCFRKGPFVNVGIVDGIRAEVCRRL